MINIRFDKTQLNRIKERKKLLRYRKIAILVLGIAVVLLLILGMGRMKKTKEAARIEKEKQEAIDKAEQEKKDAEEERERRIEQVLTSDKYGAQLRELYARYPQVEKILLDRDSYPDWLIEYFTKHKEAVDWVVDYPEYMAKGSDALNEAVPASVDLSEYQLRNNIPLYYQWDQTWGYASYGSGTIAVNGCGPTCLAMVVTGLTGDGSATPKKVADLSMEWGYCTNDVTDWALMTDGASRLGVHSWQITKWTVEGVQSELRAGHPIICSMGPGDFTEQGHFIVLTGVTDDGKIIVNDPNSRINSRKKWDAKRLLDQMKGMWAFSV